MNEEALKIRPPLFMVGKKVNCWRCDARMAVVALLAPHVDHTEDQVCILSNIERLPTEILNYIQGRVPYFKKKYSKTAGQRYYVNTCPKCGMLSGDFYLHGEPEGAFFPVDEEGAKSLYIKEIPLSNSVDIFASIGVGIGELILDNAKRV